MPATPENTPAQLEQLRAAIVESLIADPHYARFDRQDVDSLAKAIVTTPETFNYSPWRHGGWYVLDVRYPGGGCGCVSRNYVDKKWRIACDNRRVNLGEPGDFTFGSRDEAALAEHALAIQAWVKHVEGRVHAQTQGDQDAQAERAGDRPRG